MTRPKAEEKYSNSEMVSSKMKIFLRKALRQWTQQFVTAGIAICRLGNLGCAVRNTTVRLEKIENVLRRFREKNHAPPPPPDTDHHGPVFSVLGCADGCQHIARQCRKQEDCKRQKQKAVQRKGRGEKS